MNMNMNIKGKGKMIHYRHRHRRHFSVPLPPATLRMLLLTIITITKYIVAADGVHSTIGSNHMMKNDDYKILLKLAMRGGSTILGTTLVSNG